MINKIISLNGLQIIENPNVNIRFRQVAACSADSFINVKVAAVAALTAGTTGVAMSFDAASTTESNMLCDVRLYDATGATVVLTNTNKVSTGRRLLQSSGSSSWNSNNGQVTWQYGNSNAATSAQSSVGVLAVGMATAVVARFL